MITITRYKIKREEEGEEYPGRLFDGPVSWSPEKALEWLRGDLIERYGIVRELVPTRIVIQPTRMTVFPEFTIFEGGTEEMRCLFEMAYNNSQGHSFPYSK